jgi:hypothetical protein
VDFLEAGFDQRSLAALAQLVDARRVDLLRYVESQRGFIGARHAVEPSNGFLKVVGENHELLEPLRAVNPVTHASMLLKPATVR